jgi:hypothetical protein
LAGHGPSARLSTELTTAEVKDLNRACGTDLAGARDRAPFLVGFVGGIASIRASCHRFGWGLRTGRGGPLAGRPRRLPATSHHG